MSRIIALPSRRTFSQSLGFFSGFCSTEAFSPERGGREGATKLMIVLTDGESHDGEELEDALEECEKRNVTRYAIAVLGHYIRRKKDPNSFINEIKYIASDPDEKYFFNVTDEAALNDIVDSLGDRIFSLEGTREYNSFELEMSQVGFSTHLLEDGILFGMVGAYDWDGAVLKEGQSGRVIPPREAFAREFPRKLNNHAAYLGYTVSSIRLRSGRRLYLASAPRFQHKGKVILFEMDGEGGVSISQALTGDQIGSYFGSEVCPVDVNGDGVTDVLLVAAPMFLGPQNKEIGCVYLYRVGQSLLTFNGTLFPDPKPQDARFGYAMLAVPDLNHDSFNDVVVGAPLEDNHQGAVYLYHGYRTTVLPRFKQRIESAAFHLGLRYFGRSLDGQIDMDGDGLVDLAVGAQDAAVVLRSRRIVQINASISVNPPSINVIQKNCQRNGKESLCVTANFCFSVSSRSLGPRDSIKYNISLDDRKFGTRAVFDSSSQKLLQKRTRATVGRTACSTARFHIIVSDTSDYLRPVTITMKFALSENESPGPVLDEKLPTTVKKLIPFFKDCGEDDECVTDLVLQAEMDINGSRQKPHVIRKGKRKMVVDVLLENKKENAYNTTLQIWFSRNLHFSSLGFKGENPVKMECSVSSAQARVCSVDYPVFRSSAKVAFALEFEFSCSSLLNKVQVKLTARCLRFRSFYFLFCFSESTLNRYEVHPVGTFPSDMSPEFRTTIKVKMWKRKSKTLGGMASFGSALLAGWGWVGGTGVSLENRPIPPLTGPTNPIYSLPPESQLIGWVSFDCPAQEKGAGKQVSGVGQEWGFCSILPLPRPPSHTHQAMPTELVLLRAGPTLTWHPNGPRRDSWEGHGGVGGASQGWDLPVHQTSHKTSYGSSQTGANR
uniref:Integrin subunit alpha 10 n=1 Tax=Naja naja TaxID=35670 RepID=A0A8C6YF17_NAJNA